MQNVGQRTKPMEGTSTKRIVRSQTATIVSVDFLQGPSRRRASSQSLVLKKILLLHRILYWDVDNTLQSKKDSERSEPTHFLREFACFGTKL